MKITLPSLLPLLWLTFLSPIVLIAQQSEYTLIFQITADEAETLYQHESDDLYSEPYLYQLVDSFDLTPPSLPVGHYLFVSAAEEALHIEQHSIHKHNLHRQTGTNELRLEVLDTTGNRRSNARLIFQEQEVKWQEELQLYRHKRPREDGWLRVELPGDTLFYQVKHDKIKPQRKNFFRTPFGYLISTPYRWAKNTYQYFKRGFGRGQWHLNWNRIWPFPKKDRRFLGYIALSQPLYRPGDTMRVKTYLTKRNGNPWKGPLKVELTSQRNQKILSRDLLPERPGAFTAEIVLADTLKLDQYYTLRFSVPGESKYGSKAEQFRLEDYQLDAAKFTLELPETTYYGGTPVVFTASAKDQNNNPLPGATIELIALRETVTAIGPDSLLIPDTLWNHRQDLSLRLTNEICFPDSLLPAADLGIRVQAFFATAGGESNQQTKSFLYRHRSGEIDYELTDGVWTFRYLEADSQRNNTATMETWRAAVPAKQSQAIKLPHQEPLDPFVTAYTLSTPQQQQVLRVNVGEILSGLQVSGYHLGDSLLVQLNNPNRLPVRYQLFAGQQLAEEGETQGDLTIRRKARAGTPYQLNYQYVWAGIPGQEQKTFRTYKKQLQLSADLPDQIYPGQTVQVKVTATDYQGRAAKRTELVAGSVNGKFNSTEHLTPPRFNYKEKKSPRQKHRYNLLPVSGTHQSHLSRDWYQRLSLDTALYYKIRYPEKGIFLQYDTITKDTFYHRHPQISPYVVKDGQLQPIYMIYLNRKLVYSHFSEDNTPYAFTGRWGNNQLRIRTREAEYRLENVRLKPGHKLTISLDENTYGKHPEHGSYTFRNPAPDHLTKGEKALLNQTLFRIKNEHKLGRSSYLYLDSIRYYRWRPQYGSQPRVIGPVPASQKLTYLQTDGFKNVFLYEPGYVYSIAKNRERLYANTLFSADKPYELAKELPHPLVHGLALSPADILAFSPAQENINYRQNWEYRSKGGCLQLFAQAPILAITLQSANGKYGVFPASQRKFNHLAPDYYELKLIAKDGTSIRKKVWIAANHLQLLDLTKATFKPDTSSNLLEELYQRETAKPSFLDKRTSTTTPKIINPYEGKGYLASGVLLDAESNEPLIFANVLLAGTDIGTTTDLDGNWSLWVPDANAVIQFSYLGYSNVRVQAFEATQVTALADYSLSEVVVVAYKIPLIEQDNTTQGKTITAAEVRNLPTRKINALAATTAGLSSGVDTNLRGNRDGATVYYVDGVRVQGNILPETGVLPTSDGFGNSGLLTGGGLRTNFRDYGFWQPDLITDEQGEAYFQVTFPDDITRWQAYVLGMDDRKRAGAWYGATRAFQPVLAQLYLPRFLLPGDEIDLVGSSVNYTSDTFQIETKLEVNGEVLLRKKQALIDGLTDEVNYTAVKGQDSLTAKYTLQTGNYLEGEERSIPLFRVGTEETIGGFHRLEGDTTLQLEFDPADGPVTIYAQPDLLSVMLNEIEALIDYPYACNEQSASRLLAMLMQKEVYTLIGKTYEQEDGIRKMVALLRQRQRSDGSWGWWGGSPRNQWMTIYVLRALHAAKEAGYTTEAYEKGLLFLTNQLSSLTGKNRLEAIALFSELGQNMDYAALLQPYDTLPGLNWMTLTTSLIQLQQDLPYQLDTLDKYQKETLFGSHYWGESGYGFYDNTQQYSLLAYRIQRAAGNQAALAPIRQYFMEQRHRTPGYHWRAGFRNTFEAAMILRTVLPDLLEDYRQPNPPDFQQRLQVIADHTITWDTLPQQITLTTNEPIRLRKTGVGTTYLTAYQRRWNERPERVEGPFIVSSELSQGGTTTKKLVASRPAQMKVELVVEKASDYVLLEVPIPAGCSYGSKRQNAPYYSRSNQETYREYFRNKVAIFCEHLEPGTYTYTVELEPRFTGRFQLNPAKAEQMYFPIFYGREGRRLVKIE